jgi:hypothetical protein
MSCRKYNNTFASFVCSRTNIVGLITIKVSKPLNKMGYFCLQLAALAKGGPSTTKTQTT